ncbi:hypothetical protein PBY51_021806 [Eleginops maclovinus]|uniref:Uncharacterized protein n=1 Tax=Eleginops maclovinus TaxID=56733 RepID=A0AAN7XGA5_ELEMC|nr:hypothetical protein PBY51_021806 [Eleginops maclovinus]
MSESPSYLPYPGHSYFYADNGGPLVFVSPETPFPSSVSTRMYSGMHQESRCGSVKCGHRLHKYWCVYRYSPPLSGFFPPWSWLGPGAMLRCYWSVQTQSPAHACVT